MFPPPVHVHLLSQIYFFELPDEILYCSHMTMSLRILSNKDGSSFHRVLERLFVIPRIGENLRQFEVLMCQFHGIGVIDVFQDAYTFQQAFSAQFHVSCDDKNMASSYLKPLNSKTCTNNYSCTIVKLLEYSK